MQLKCSVMIERLMQKKSPKSSEINKFKSIINHEVKSKTLRLVMNNKQVNNMDDS
jgi:hypothetical protein